MKTSSILFKPLKLGSIEIPNRIIMSPCTRCRASEKRIPTDMMIKYYTDRASAGLIITEATSVCPIGVGYPNTPGIWNKEQVLAWKRVTEAIHKEKGRIFLQLWHVGRVSDPIYLDGKLPVAPSAIAAEGHINLVRPKRNYVVPHALELSEIPAIVESFKSGAINAKEAGFDGVEIHGANGYLLDQFLQDISNKRIDQYGGCVENRARFMLEVTDAVISVWGAERVGMHLAPGCDLLSMGDSNPLKTFSYVVKELNRRQLAFIFSREAQGEGYIGDKLRKEFDGVFIANQQLTQVSAEKIIDVGNADAVAFGQLFIANPDLPERFKSDSKLNEPHPETFFSNGAKGYNDYPKLG
ncbi:MAG: alkene reductase [Lentisphaerota bacterium]